MSNCIKIFGNIIINFVDQMFLPILNYKLAETIKVIDQWNQLKVFINENQNVQVKKLEQFIIDLTYKNTILTIPKLCQQQNQQATNNLWDSSSLYLDQPWKLIASQKYPNIQNQKGIQYPQSPSIDLNKMPIKSQDNFNINLFQNLIFSFKKLCNNFQNNQKKLMMEHKESFSLWVDSYQ